MTPLPIKGDSAGEPIPPWLTAVIRAEVDRAIAAERARTVTALRAAAERFRVPLGNLGNLVDQPVAALLDVAARIERGDP